MDLPRHFSSLVLVTDPHSDFFDFLSPFMCKTLCSLLAEESDRPCVLAACSWETKHAHTEQNYTECSASPRSHRLIHRPGKSEEGERPSCEHKEMRRAGWWGERSRLEAECVPMSRQERCRLVLGRRAGPFGCGMWRMIQTHLAGEAERLRTYSTGQCLSVNIKLLWSER